MASPRITPEARDLLAEEVVHERGVAAGVSSKVFLVVRP